MAYTIIARLLNINLSSLKPHDSDNWHGYCVSLSWAAMTARNDTSKSGQEFATGRPMSKIRIYAWFAAAGGLIVTYAVLMFVI